MYITNAFSINMLPREEVVAVLFTPISLDEAREIAAKGLESAIGHADTARIVSDLLGVEIPSNRVDIRLQNRDRILVAQYSGPRLPEGATTLPEGAKIEFWLVTCIALKR